MQGNRALLLVAVAVWVLTITGLRLFFAPTDTRGPSVSDFQAAPEQDTGRTEKKLVRAGREMVVAAHPAASQAGMEVLAQGGNAIDAMVVVQLVLNLVEPQSSGIGGGAFALYWDAAQKKLFSFDGRETAPQAAGPDYFLESDGTPMNFWNAVVGGRSVGVPGTLKLLETVHNRFGQLPWPTLLQPAIELAENGFEVSPRLALSIASAKERSLDLFPETRAYFFEGDGSPKAAGTPLRNPEFADTLRLLLDGSDPFYRGEIAQDIVEAVAQGARPGLMTLEDLADYRVKERAPVCVPYRGFEVCGMGPPSSGGFTVGQMLGIMSHFDMAGLPREDAIHVYLESAKLAYADRGKYMADTDFVEMPAAGLLDPRYMQSRASLIELQKAGKDVQPGEPPWSRTAARGVYPQPEPAGTSHFVIRDRQGNALSVTTTIEIGFGSRLMTRGFLLNNELTDFSFVPEIAGRPVANRVEGGKRPRSSMAPTIVFKDGDPYFLVGSPGGSRIINYVAKTLVAVLDWGLNPQEAIDMLHFSNRNGATELEAGTDSALNAALEARGHETRTGELNSGVHAILIESEALSGAADPRREGLAVGR